MKKDLTTKKYKVTYAIDYIDPNPTIKYFDEWHTMQEWVDEEVQGRIDRQVQYILDKDSPFFITKKDLRAEVEENEYSLIKIEEL